MVVNTEFTTKWVMAHEVQMVNYLVATQKAVGLIINFGERKVQTKRKVNDLDGDIQDKFKQFIS
ncbi:unnamed protein product [marine sediment metagenome]|uniref:GxxExxY protein n=1 Tax=marine sediment metagenome TaxID=412755 RepID=X0XBC6_9ZZZZ